MFRITMAGYPFSEQADMIFMYGRANGNGREAARLYHNAFPDRTQPSHPTFAAVYRRIAETGTLAPQTVNRGTPRSARTIEQEEHILQAVEMDPAISTRRLAVACGTSRSTAWRVLHEQSLYPYHLQRVQGLSPADYPPRANFCRWFIAQTANPRFVSSVLFTDEATFGRDGITNLHNMHVWSDENPHGTLEVKHQQRFNINVWAGIVGDYLIGPYVLPARLTGAVYKDFILNTLPELLEDVPLQIRGSIWFMHDGAPVHFSRIVREVLDDLYHAKWIGRGGPVPWPARSPDLNPLDYYLWGHLKQLVYAADVPNAATLHQRILEACDTIRHRPGIFERVRRSMVRRVHACTEASGGHFEHLL